MQSQYKQCPQCGAVAYLNAPQCHQCGRAYRTQFQNQTQAFTPTIPGRITVPSGTHSAVCAFLLSLFLCGTGQGYNKQGPKGLVIFLMIVGVTVFLGFLGLGFLAVPLYIAQVIDAALIASKLNRGESVSEWELF